MAAIGPIDARASAGDLAPAGVRATPPAAPRAGGEPRRAAGAAAASARLDEGDRRVIAELAKTDAAVRAHERAHQAAAGGLAGPASFSYQRGPDGKLYAVAGEVPIALREGRTPEETLTIARKVRAAASAPADPSTQDRAVAAAAAAMEARAMTEIASARREEATGSGEGEARAATGARAAAAYAAARPTERPPRVDRIA